MQFENMSKQVSNHLGSDTCPFKNKGNYWLFHKTLFLLLLLIRSQNNLSVPPNQPYNTPKISNETFYTPKTFVLGVFNVCLRGTK